MDLPVRRQLLVLGEHQRVQRPGRVVGRLEHARQPGRTGPAAELPEPLDERAVDRLGEGRKIGAGLAEVAGERLGEDHEIGLPGQRGDLVECGEVLGRVERGGALHQPDAQALSGLASGTFSEVLSHTSQSASRGARLRTVTSSARAPGPAELGGIVLTGGSAVRIQGADKASIEVAGATLLEHALAALADVPDVVVVGEEVTTSRPVTFRARILPGVVPPRDCWQVSSGFPRTPARVVVLAVDMPMVTAATVRRLLRVGRRGRRAAGRRERSAAVPVRGLPLRVACEPLRRPLEEQHGLPMRRLVASLNLGEVPALAGESRDVDTWEDLLALRDQLEESDADEVAKTFRILLAQTATSGQDCHREPPRLDR